MTSGTNSIFSDLEELFRKPRVGSGLVLPTWDRHTKVLNQKDLETYLNKLLTDKGNTMVISGKYIIGSWQSHRGLSVANSPRLHDTLAQAKTEAERLARQNPGTTYVTLRVEGSVTANGVQWT